MEREVGDGKEREGKGGKERERDLPDQCQIASYAPVTTDPPTQPTLAFLHYQIRSRRNTSSCRPNST